MTDLTAAPSSGEKFDPARYPRRYRIRWLWWTFFSFIFLVMLVKFLKGTIHFIVSQKISAVEIPLLVIPFIFLAICIWLFAMACRGTFRLYPDRLVSGFWPRKKTIRRNEIESFRVSDKPAQILVLILKDEPRKAVTIPIQQLATDTTFWHWFETLDGLGPYEPPPRSKR